MKTVCKSMFTSCLVGMFTLVAVAATYAQSAPKPAVVVSIAPLNEQMSDIKYLVKESGFGQANFLIKSFVDQYTNGMDRERPAGVLLYFKGDNPVPQSVVFIPIKDVDDFLDSISNVAEIDDEDDVIKITPFDSDTVYAVEREDHIFIALDEKSLAELPADPQSMLGDMPKNYNLAAHVYGGRVPDELREKAIDMIKDGYIDSLQNLGGDPGTVDQQVKDFEEQIKVLSDIDEIVFGIVADGESHKMAMEFTVTGKPGSKVAKSYAGFAKTDPTRFAGFMNDKAAADYNMCFNVSGEDSEQIGKQMDGLVESMMTELDNDGEFSDEELDSIRNAAVQIAEVVEETFKAGRIDSGGQLMMGENDFNFVSGGQVSDPKKIETATKELIEVLRERAGDKLQFNLDFARENGINMHEIIFKVPEDEEELQDYIGSEVIILLGIGEKDVYFAAGKSPMDTLKKAIANSAAAAPEYPVVYNLRVTPILEFAASTTGQPMIDGMVEKLREVGRDKMTVFSKAIENGLFTRMEMEDGPLSLIQGIFEAQMGGGAEF